jgi:hypothetical protein
MAALHETFAWLSVAAAVLMLVVAGAAAAGLGPGRRAVDRAIIVVVAVVGATALAGVILPFSEGPPRDLLHFVYGVVALGAAPIARALARSRDPRRVGAYVAFGTFAVLGAVLRLFMTGR